MNKLRGKLLSLSPEEFLKRVRGARRRELAARYLLLHLDQVPTATPEDRAALDEYVIRAGWKSLYGRDRRMYQLLRGAAEKYQGRKRPKRKSAGGCHPIKQARQHINLT